MCGVVGIYSHGARGAPVGRDELRSVRDHMAARGPDGKGEWFSADGRVGLGHRRLAIIDLSERGAQPMASGSGQIVISFNGEIYNHRELRRELERKGRVFRSDSDTEVVLQLYEEHGTAMLSMLRGMFAFVLWDARQRALLLARDAFGIKPLYYAKSRDTFRCASQVKALLRADVDSAPDAAGHAGFFLWGSVPAPHTLYRGILSLPAGHFMWVRETGAMEPQPYRTVTGILARAASEPARGSREDALDAIAAALKATTSAHLVADVPVGLFLSGGMDSTMLASLVSQAGARPRTVTLGFTEYAGTGLDESALAREVALLTGAQHCDIRIGKADFAAEREKLLAAMDQPSIDGVNTWFVARAAASAGIKVALSGLGGDELFASYPSFRQVPRLARAVAPLSHVPGLGRAWRHLSAPFLGLVTSPKYASVIEYGGTVEGAYLLRRSLHMPPELGLVMDPDMARAGLEALQPIARLHETTEGIASESPARLKLSALETSWYMRHQLLADADWASMAHSLEIRVPFADAELLEAVAPWLASHPDISKRDVVAHAAPALPKRVLDRHKTGFVVPVREWLGAPRSARGLRGWAKYVHARFAPVAGSPSQDQRPRVLVATLAPGAGGVSAMTEFAVRTLAERGLQPVLAYYATYGAMPELSVPATHLLRRKPATQTAQAYGGHEIHAIGAWLPELEFTHYAPTAYWRELMDSCSAYVVASGNVLPATPFLLTKRPYLAWVATDWDGDRRDRVRRFPMIRRVLDTCVNAPVIRRLESRLLRGGRIVALSHYTREMLAERAGTKLEAATLAVPVDVALFKPNPAARVAGRIGFAGRFNDPRKNIELLLHAAVRLRELGCEFTVLLMGDAPNAHVRELVEKLALGSQVTFRSGMSRSEMRDCMQTLDVFVLPSHQEGLCIAALEALACGVPVVSTRCGGPEEFVIPGVTGDLVAADPRSMAEAIEKILRKPGLRSELSAAGRELVRDRYSRHRAEAVFVRELEAAFPGLVRKPFVSIGRAVENA